MEIIGFIGLLISIINRALIPLIFAVAFLLFLWGILQFFFLNGENEEKRKEGRKFIIAGIIGFFIMMSIWGIVNVLLGTFGFQYQSRPPLPSFSGSAGGSYGNATGGFGSRANPSAPLTTPGMAPNGQVREVVGQRCGGQTFAALIPPTTCMPWNECIGGQCITRSGNGGVGESCLDGGRCVNGSTCDSQTGTCVRAGSN